MNGETGRHRSLLGDLLRVKAALRPDNATMTAIVAMLGAGSREEPVAPVGEPDGDDPAGVGRVGPPAESPTEQAAPQQPEEVSEPDEMDDELDVLVTEGVRAAPSVPEWLRAARPLLVGPSNAPSLSDPWSMLPPLFPRKRARAVVSGFLAMPGEGEVDVDALSERVARGHAVHSVPRRVRPTLGRGVHVLVDRGDSMMPFLGDIASLTKDIARVAGLGQRIESFIGTPLRGCGSGPKRSWSAFASERSPLPGSRIVCITDLGLGEPAIGQSPADPEEWLQFAVAVRRLGCSPSAIVPYEPARWPASLRRAMDLLFWDPATRASDALRGLLRRARA